MNRATTLFSLLFLAACGYEPPVTDWRVLIELPESQVPVRLHLAADGSEAWFRNGTERVPVPGVSRSDAGWTLHFPTYNNTLVLKQEGERLGGTLTLVKRGYQQVMEVTGEPYRGFRFMPDPEPAVDLTGRWAVTFTADDGTETPAVAEFDQQGAVITGTFLTSTGDYRYLAGEVDGTELRLSTFDGAHAFVFHARARDDGSLDGDFWSGTRWHEDWVAEKDFDAKLPDAWSLTYIKDGYDGIEFSFPDLDGNPVSLSDEKYRGKVVLVTLAGTWCPNCADEAEFLAGYYRENRDRGLEIIMLLYEHYEDFARAAQQGKALVRKHAIDFDVLVAGISDKTQAAETLPMLNQLLAFPTIVFIDRQGDVRRIHTGFSGPGTGEHFEDFKREFHNYMDELLAEPVAQPAT